MEHLTPMQLATLLDGLARPGEESAASRHFEQCPDCFEQWLLGLQAKAAEARENRERTPGAPRVVALPLLPALDDWDDRAAAADQPAPLPTLTTENHEILVQFRESREGGPIRAFLVGPKAAIPENLRLHLPEAGLVFSFDARGVAELHGICADQLRGARLELTLAELDGREGQPPAGPR